MIHSDFIAQTNSQPPSELLPWVHCKTSLTEKLINEAGEANLCLLHQGKLKRDWWAYNVLGLEDEEVYQREILMKAHRKPCWYARTIIPMQTYEQNHHLFERLKKESLTQILFEGDAVVRQDILSYPITPESIEYHWLLDSMHGNQKLLWARLSIYQTQSNHLFYLVEILLPGLLEVLA